MENQLTTEIHFASFASTKVCAIRPGVPRDAALSMAAEVLATAHSLMLLASEMDSHPAQTAATWLVEIAQAAIQAAQK